MDGSWLTGKSANFGNFAALMHPIIDPLPNCNVAYLFKNLCTV